MALKIFVSYSHKDANDFEDLLTHLKPLTRGDGAVEQWTDQKLRIGDDWRAEIRASINRCDIAVLLVSPNFFASEFIDSEELKPLRERHERGEIEVVCVPLSHSRIQEDEWLSRFHTIPSPDTPIRRMGRARRDQAYDEIRQHIQTKAGGPISRGAVRLPAGSAQPEMLAPSKVDYKKQHFVGETIFLPEMYIRRGPYSFGKAAIYGVRFEKCRIIGPAIVYLGMGSELKDSSFDAPDHDIDAIVYTNYSKDLAGGLIPLMSCGIFGCELTNIGFFSPQESVEAFRRMMLKGGED